MNGVARVGRLDTVDTLVDLWHSGISLAEGEGGTGERGPRPLELRQVAGGESFVLRDDHRGEARGLIDQALGQGAVARVEIGRTGLVSGGAVDGEAKDLI